MVRDATAEKNKQRMTAVTGRERGRGSCAAKAVAIFLVAAVAVDTSGALPTWRRLGFRTGSGVSAIPIRGNLLNRVVVKCTSVKM